MSTSNENYSKRGRSKHRKTEQARKQFPQNGTSQTRNKSAMSQSQERNSLCEGSSYKVYEVCATQALKAILEKRTNGTKSKSSACPDIPVVPADKAYKQAVSSVSPMEGSLDVSDLVEIIGKCKMSQEKFHDELEHGKSQFIKMEEKDNENEKLIHILKVRQKETDASVAKLRDTMSSANSIILSLKKENVEQGAMISVLNETVSNMNTRLDYLDDTCEKLKRQILGRYGKETVLEELQKSVTEQNRQFKSAMAKMDLTINESKRAQSALVRQTDNPDSTSEMKQQIDLLWDTTSKSKSQNTILSNRRDVSISILEKQVDALQLTIKDLESRIDDQVKRNNQSFFGKFLLF